jgi:hypothetical protein
VRVLAVLLEDFYDGLPFTPISLHAVDLLRSELETEKEIMKKKGKKRQVKK